MSKPLKKFSTQADEHLLDELKKLAEKEGKQFQVLVNEAFEDLIEKKKQLKPRKHVIAHFEKSMLEFDDLYKELAK
ncbi:MAG: hypothetical protein WCK67_12905 [bacterium]